MFRPSGVAVLVAFLLQLPFLNAANVSLPSYPLAVRSPYLSAWLPGNYSDNVPKAQPEFWSGKPLNWIVLARVDSDFYCLFGCRANGTFDQVQSANQTSIRYTSTHTYIGLDAGPANFVLDFFSPVSPRNLIRQSFPYSYLTVQASGANVQILSAIDETWWGGPRKMFPKFATTNAKTTYYEVYDKDAPLFKESKDQLAGWGSLVFASQPSKTSKLSYQCGYDADLLDALKENGSLENSVFCDVDQLWALSHDMGDLRGPSNVTFAIGQQQYKSVEYQKEAQVSYIFSKFETVLDTADAFFEDFPAAESESYSIDQFIRKQGDSISSNYSDICEASVRQHFGGYEFTVNEKSKDPINPWLWNKEISSGNKVNTVDVIYPGLPFMLIMNPYWIKWSLDPILQHILSKKWDRDYIIHDLGHPYPLANRDANWDEGEKIPIQVTGSFFIMAQAYQQATGDKAWIQQHIPKLTRFADYLQRNGTSPHKQLSTVDAIGPIPNRTDLAIQAALGLKSFGVLSGQEKYTTAGVDLARHLYEDGVGLDKDRTHFTFQYGKDSGWSIIFNSFIDKLLNLQTFPEEAWSMQSSFYEKQIQPGGMPYAGGDVDCGHNNKTKSCNWAITDWTMWAAATSPPELMHKFIDKGHEFMTGGSTSVPLPTKFFVKGPKMGQYVVNKARSTVGSNFAILALNGTGQYPGSTGDGPGGSGLSGAGGIAPHHNGASSRLQQGTSILLVVVAFMTMAWSWS